MMGVEPLVLIEGTLDQNGHVDVTSNHLVPYLKKVDEQCPGVIFQDDNAPCHTAKYPTWWLQTHGIDCVPRPAQSPNLNPIERVWGDLDQERREKAPRHSSAIGWRQHLKTSGAELLPTCHTV